MNLGSGFIPYLLAREKTLNDFTGTDRLRDKVDRPDSSPLEPLKISPQVRYVVVLK
jgi:hypothetical protein